MASRDYENYVYLTIGIKKNSPAHLGLLRDAEAIDTKQLPTVAAMILQHYYTVEKKQPVVVEQERSPAHQNGKTAGDIMVKDASTADANADAALDEWE